jgi:hypothetical protein
MQVFCRERENAPRPITEIKAPKICISRDLLICARRERCDALALYIRADVYCPGNNAARCARATGGREFITARNE